jgi:hypothetical protein
MVCPVKTTIVLTIGAGVLLCSVLGWEWPASLQEPEEQDAEVAAQKAKAKAKKLTLYRVIGSVLLVILHLELFSNFSLISSGLSYVADVTGYGGRATSSDNLSLTDTVALHLPPAHPVITEGGACPFTQQEE